MMSSGPGSDMLVHMPGPDLVVVVGCMACIVVGPDMTVQASANTVSLLLPFPDSTPQMDEE